MIFILIPLFIVLAGAGLYAAFTSRFWLIVMIIAVGWCYWHNWTSPHYAEDVQKAAADMQAHAKQWAKEDGVPYVDPLVNPVN